MTQNEIIKALHQLGTLFESCKPEDDLINKAHIHNKWFTPEMQMAAFKNWAIQLTEAKLLEWASAYSFSDTPKSVGIIMAGNIPLVGLHDMICVLVSGHYALIKPSSDDSILTPWIIETLCGIDKRLGERIKQTEKLNTIEALIATGSNNSARHFNYYFKDKPKILRKNRNSVAILTGNESLNQLQDLGSDIFMYFGLGCRNISKLLVPESYNFDLFFEAIEPYNHCIHHHKYYNNYTYHKAIFLMNLTPHLDNGFLILKEDDKLASPLGCLFYERFSTTDGAIEYLQNNKEDIQISVGDEIFGLDCLAFGQSQNTALNDYADKVNTMKFLNEL